MSASNPDNIIETRNRNNVKKPQNRNNVKKPQNRNNVKKPHMTDDKTSCECYMSDSGTNCNSCNYNNMNDANSNSSNTMNAHWRQAAYLLPEPLQKTAGDIIQIEVIIDINCGVFLHVLSC